MQLTYSQLSVPGPVRERNEDYIGFFHPATLEERRARGSVAIIADGVGGQGDGDIASRVAVESAMDIFTDAELDTSPNTLLWEMFKAANLAVYDSGMSRRDKTGKRMATTLTICIFRDDRIYIGHVGDCRVYIVQQGRLRRITNDHSYAGVQLKLGLITVQEAANSELRSVLTRCVGQDPFVRPDYSTTTVRSGDLLVLCCDGLYSTLNEGEVYDAVTKNQPEEACKQLIDLAVRREAGDNLSVQVIRVEITEQVDYYRGLPVYRKAPERMSDEIQVGQVLDGRFRVDELISTSGMASIFKCTDLKDNRTVAMKLPFMKFESDPGFFSRFQREQEIGSKLNHPYILHVEPIDADDRSRPYLVMEYLEGQTLGQLMRAIKPMPVGDSLRIASRICEALEYLHDHDVVHRDLKPDNVMICTDGSIRIMDFGIAKLEGARRLTFGGFQPAMGTPDYMAPEQVKGKRGDARTDIYSLGAMLYEMVTGRPPFEGDNPLLIMNARLNGDPVAPRSANPEIPETVEEIILHAMSRPLGERYASARDMKHELDHADEVKLTGRAARLQPVVHWKGNWQRHRMVVLCVAIPFLIFLVIFLSKHLHISVR